jgi:hypothetical protein
MKPAIRKLNLTAHVTSSVGWLGAVAAFLALAITGLTSGDDQRARAVYLAMEVTTWCIILPLSFASPVTGIVQSLGTSWGTSWGLFRYYWVFVKFLITIPCTGLLLLHIRPVGHLAAVVREATLLDGECRGMQIKLAANAGAAVVALLAATTLSVFKPWGRIGYAGGNMREDFEASDPTSKSDQAALLDERVDRTVLPLRLKIVFTALVVLLAAVAVIHLTGGGHGGHAH